MRGLLRPLVPVYGGVVRTKAWMFDRGWLGVRALGGVVISVGSISAGGAGKTPVVLLLAELLKRRGYAVDVLTRGYGRRSGVVERVDPEGDAGRYGDEPLLLARRLGVPVYVGADRYEAGLLGEAGDGRAVHVLDDGFQHRRLARALDVVLVTRKDVRDWLLPAGNLREPLSALRRADVLVVREEEDLREFLAEVAPGVEVWRVRRRLEMGGVGLRRLVAFCGIARPEGFFGMLKAAGCRPVGMEVFGDHHAYGHRDVTRLIERARACGADGFVTTEKDAVKLTGKIRGRLEEVGALVVAELRLELMEEERTMARLIAVVEGRR